ncbi:MAG TPA: nuclear transport factor 2 family protein [Acidimicrobiales bacterium]
MGSRTVDRMYRAFAERDLDGLRSVLAGDFVGHVSAGMPLGVGGRHDGAEAMIHDVWLPVFGAYDVTPVPDSIVEVGDTAVVHGWYRGTVRATGEEVAAELVHLLTLDGERDRITGLRQVTDTASWPPPAAPEA